MEDAEVLNGDTPCNVCGERKVISRAGFMYCYECGIRTTASQMVDFTHEYTENYIKVTRIKENKVKYGELWTSWHVQNMIMLGLVEELACCCTREKELKSTTLKLWGRYLKVNKIAFFNQKTAAQPKLPINFRPRDLKYLYNISQPKKPRTRKRKNVNDENLSRRLLSRKKTIATRRHFEKLMASQSTQATISTTLEDLQKDEAAPKPTSVSVTGFTRRVLLKKLSHRQLKFHLKQGYCGPGCKCLRTQTKNLHNFRHRMVTWMTLYSILCLALYINCDEAQIGDVIRWCREGHLTYGDFHHFIPDDLVFTKHDKKFILNRSINMSYSSIRSSMNAIANYIGLTIIGRSDICILIRRYIIELELPIRFFTYVQKLVYKYEKLFPFEAKSKDVVQCLEGIAMAYIIITMKIFFGFDDKIEIENSEAAIRANNVLGLMKSKKVYPRDFQNEPASEKVGRWKRDKIKLFVLKEWMEYIEYRKICISEYHYPTRMQLYPEAYDKGKLYLHHMNVIDKRLNKPKRKCNFLLTVRSIMERIVDSDETTEETFPKFYCSLYPMNEYVETLLNWNYYPSSPTFNREILEEDFSAYDVSYVARPSVLSYPLGLKRIDLETKKNRYIDHYEGVCKIRSEEVLNCPKEGDVEVTDCMLSEWIDINSIVDVKNALDDYHDKEAMEANLKYQKKLFPPDEVRIKSGKRGTLIFTECYDNYWIRHYADFLNKFNVARFKNELDNAFPKNFVWLLRQCASMVEMDEVQMYHELSMLEKKILSSHKTLKVKPSKI